MSLATILSRVSVQLNCPRLLVAHYVRPRSSLTDGRSDWSRLPVPASLILPATPESNLSLGDAQNALVAQVAAANPKTIVVVRCPGAILMPWIDAVKAVIEGQ